MSATQPVRLERDGRVGIVLLGRPPANSYDYSLLRELSATIDEARWDDSVRGLVIASSSEKFFCAYPR